ncbi:MAG: phosphatase PAP2 family protein [Muribaculaceae bacterium]|nr:phosphatase PAP2 family protein [Muribaculaceae bacterium]
MRARVVISLLMFCVFCGLDMQGQDLWDDDVTLPDFAPPARIYGDASVVPNGTLYLPAPVDTTKLEFAGDFARWQWGKRIRQTKYGTRTARGNQAYYESQYGLNRWCVILPKAIGVSITGTNTPRNVSFIYQVGETGSRSTEKAKLKYNRRRPFDQMNETTWGYYDDAASLLRSGSFPSSHAAFGWAVALAYAEMVPERQDTIMRHGYMYGESREIVGAHWHSDVLTAFLTASAAWAYMHTRDDFHQGLESAREEYYQIKGGEPDTSVGWPRGRKIQDAPVDSTSLLYYDDVMGYWQAKALRDTERGLQAIDDADDSETYFLRMFSDAIKDTLTQGKYPMFTELFSVTYDALKESALELRSTAFRKRPFVQFDEPTLVPGEEARYADQSSYPSVKAQLGWGLSLLMVEMFPKYMNAVLKSGYDYGYSRVVAGYNYPSDVMAGRIHASCVMARLHANPEYNELIELAREECAFRPHLVTSLEDISNTPGKSDGYWYTTTGLMLKQRPTEPGIYIHAGKKIVVGGVRSD